MRLFSESPLIQSLTKFPGCVIAFRWLCHFDVRGTPPPPPLHPIIHKIQHTKITSSVITMFRCLLKVEVWNQIFIQCVWTSYSQSQIIANFATFLFWPFPKFTPPAHAPFKKSYHVYSGSIGNYPSFKLIPNTTYIVLFLKKYNR